VTKTLRLENDDLASELRDLYDKLAETQRPALNFWNSSDDSCYAVRSMCCQSVLRARPEIVDRWPARSNCFISSRCMACNRQICIAYTRVICITCTAIMALGQDHVY